MRRSTTTELATTATVTLAPEFRELALDQIHESTTLTNPRTTCDEAGLEDLANSIRQRGVLQAILVRPDPMGTGYELIAGSRRLRAARLAGFSSIPASIRVLDDATAREAAIIENLQREDVHPLDEAEAYERLQAADPLMTPDAVGAKVGKSATYVYGRLTLLRLIPVVRDAFRQGIITDGHAKRLATVPADRQEDAFHKCFFPLMAAGADGDRVDRNNLAPLRQLDTWLQTKVALNVHHEDTSRFQPALAEAVSAAEQIGGAQVLALSTLTFHTDARDPKPILARSWKVADGKQTCAHARPGVIVLGDDRGRLLQVCIEKKNCAKHWGKPKPSPASGQTRDAGADDARRQAREREERERARLERDRQFFEQQLRPALLAAIAKKAAHFKKPTPALITAVLERLTHRSNDLVRWCGPLAKITPDRFPMALMVSLALEEQFFQERLMVFAKTVGVEASAVRKRLKTAPVETSAKTFR